MKSLVYFNTSKLLLFYLLIFQWELHHCTHQIADAAAGVTLLTFSLMLSVSCRQQLLATIPPNSRNPYYLQHFTFPVIPAAAAAQVHYAFPQMLHPVSAAVIPGSSPAAPCQRELKCKSVNYIYIYVIINPRTDLIEFHMVIKYNMCL